MAEMLLKMLLPKEYGDGQQGNEHPPGVVGLDEVEPAAK